MIIQDLEDKGVCSKCEIRTRQCGAFHQDAAVPHTGNGKSCNGDKIWPNLGRAVDKDNLGALNPSLYPNHKTNNSTFQELLSEKLVHRSATAEHGHCASSNLTLSNQSLLQNRNVYWRREHKFDPNGYWSSHGFKLEESHTSPTRPYPGRSQKNWRRRWTPRELRHGTRSGSTAGQPNERGRD